MTNAELIKALKDAEGYIRYVAPSCIASDEAKEAIRAAADTLEAADKRIAELESQKPKRGEWIEKWRFKTDGTPFHKIGDMECSVCHGDMLGRYYSKYCPHCGALLRGENDERTDKA